MLNKQHKQNNK